MSDPPRDVVAVDHPTARVHRALVLCGTNRAGSRSRGIASAVERLYQRREVTVITFDLADLPGTIVHPEMYDGEIPTQIATFATTLSNADALHVVCPEYNGGIPGILKLFLDLLPHRGAVLAGCPVAVVGVSTGPTASKVVEHLQAMFIGYRAFVFPRVVHISTSRRDEFEDSQFDQRGTRKPPGPAADSVPVLCRCADAGSLPLCRQTIAALAREPNI